MDTTNKRIAKNTAFLYIRMLLMMGVALYTSRVVLEVLGASDFGLYNVVGGVVTMLSFINSSMGSGTSRFITFELGRGDKDRLSVVFNVALACHLIIALFMFLIAESIGTWFVNTQLVFDQERSFAVNIVYQASIITMFFQVTQIPYSADIIAHEQMSVYAYVSILEVTLRLMAILFLKFVPTSDGLITYAILIMLVQIIIIIIYRVYCRIHYEESKWRLVKDKKAYKEIFSFSGWDMIGGLCLVMQGQGLNILLNIYFGPVVNAARAISYQVQGAFSQFTQNFMTALNPPIVKGYAREDKKEMVKLINYGALFSYYLLLLLVLPVMFKMPFVLGIWLNEYPDNTVTFTIVVLVSMMIRALARPIVMAVHATGNIKYLNLICGIIGLFALPVSWICLFLGMNALSVFWVLFGFSILGNVTEIYILKCNLPEFSIMQHLIRVYFRSAIVTIISVTLVLFLSKLFPENFIAFVLYYGLCVIMLGMILVFAGLNQEQRGRLFKTFLVKLRR